MGLSMGCMCGKESLSIENHRYNVKQRLGEGGFSVIDLVHDTKTNRTYALKRIMCHSEADEGAAEAEAEFMRKLKHPNLVPCVGYSVSLTPNHRSAHCEALIIMPYYKKGSVFDEIETLQLRGSHMSEKRVVSHTRGLCHALHALHTQGLAHRDVKPHNVMLDINENKEEIPVLMDFGSMGPANVKIKNRQEAMSLQDYAAEKCTMPYRAPELFQIDLNSVITEKVDIWSLGCTVYAMCFNESPFDKVHQRGDSIALAAMAGNIRIPDKHSPIVCGLLMKEINAPQLAKKLITKLTAYMGLIGYSDGLIALMLRMLSVQPNLRPSAPEILSSLTNIYSTDSTTAYTPTSTAGANTVEPGISAANHGATAATTTGFTGANGSATGVENKDVAVVDRRGNETVKDTSVVTNAAVNLTEIDLNDVA